MIEINILYLELATYGYSLCYSYLLYKYELKTLLFSALTFPLLQHQQPGLGS